MYDLYKKFYDKYRATYGPQTCIFLLVGSFYELYDSQDPTTGQTECNVKEILDVLGINLTIRKGDGEAGKDGLFAGVPEFSIHKWAGKLTSQGWTVVLVDQVKRPDGSVKAREAARILSPATHTEVLGAADSAYLIGILCEEAQDPSLPPGYAATAFDLTTGVTYTLAGQFTGRGSQWVSDELAHFFQVLAPREAIVWWNGAAITQPTAEQIKQRLGTTANIPVHMRSWADLQKQSPLVREEYLRKVYNIRSLLPVRSYLHLQTEKEEYALMATLKFVEDHLPSSFERLEQNRQWCPKHQVRLGNSALTQLQMITSQQLSVLGLFDKCITPLGKRNIRRRILNPIYDRTALEQRYNRITTHQNLTEDEKKSLTLYLSAIYDIPRIHRRMLCGTPQPQDIVVLHTSYMSAQALLKLLTPYPQLQEGLTYTTPTSLITKLSELFDIQRATQASEDSTIFHRGHYTEADQTEDKIQEIKTDVEVLRKALIKEGGLSPEAIKYDPKEKSIYAMRCSKLVGENLSKSIAASTLLTTNYGQKAISLHVLKSGATVEGRWLEQAHDRTFHLRQKLQSLVGSILPTVCQNFVETTKELWEPLESWVENLDIEQCIASVSALRGFTRPTLLDGDTAKIHLENLRHPLIEATLTRTEYVKHNVTLGTEKAGNGWLIYGMNASGKSSLMKATGIAVLLAQAGAFVPASKCELAPFRCLFTRILNQDNLWAGLSSFAVEMSEMREVLSHADKHTLVLGDELCSGTESASAHALVAAGIDWLAERKACFMFATHLHSLLQILPPPEQLGLKVYHLRVHYDRARDILFYDRTLTPGPGSSLYGLEVARASAVPLEYIEKALKYRQAFLGESESISCYSEHIVRKACELCGCAVSAGLEVHHIRQQAESDVSGFFQDGSHKNDPRNLITVCDGCHDKHHAGRLEIQPLKQTSSGPMRPVSPSSEEDVVMKAKTTRKGKYDEEQQSIIEETLRKNPAGPLRRICVILAQEHDIKISEASLRLIRSRIVA
jgi:DNA mismatch repair protein MutS